MVQGGNVRQDRYRVTRRTFEHPDEIKSDWLALQNRANCSFFQSWGWIGVWLQQVVSDLGPELVEIRDDHRVVALGIFVDKEVKRRFVMRSSALFLNEYPFDGRNMVIEYNGFLIDKDIGDQAGIYAALLESIFVRQRRVDEVFFGGICEEALEAIRKTGLRPAQLAVSERSISWQVDLSRFNGGVDSFLKRLSKNRRGQIRRSMRLYEEQGPLRLSQAATVEQALEYFEGLGSLHGERWKRKGMQGSFANPLWARFHRTLIAQRYAEDEIQLIRVTVAGKPIGYLYNYLWRNRVYVLQTGFSISDDTRLMPGYVVHVLAIAHNRDKAMQTYDFMHGDSTYKRILSDRKEDLFWVAVQRRCIKFLFENSVLGLYRSAKSLYKRVSENAP
jgi:CelD/BcsL family acetyltransferase involved in cellulose biosynthesis